MFQGNLKKTEIKNITQLLLSTNNQNKDIWPVFNEIYPGILLCCRPINGCKKQGKHYKICCENLLFLIKQFLNCFRKDFCKMFYLFYLKKKYPKESIFLKTIYIRLIWQNLSYHPDQSEVDPQQNRYKLFFSFWKACMKRMSPKVFSLAVQSQKNLTIFIKKT